MSSINFKDFLKLYTGVSNKFIDKYFMFSELCEDDEYGINAKKVVKFLNITDINILYKDLRKNFIHKKDYIIKKLSKDGTKTYHLSFDGFEKLCMMSNSKNGEQVRDYLLSLSKFIDYYKNHMATKINSLTKYNKFVYIVMINKDKDIFKLSRTGNIKKILQKYVSGEDKHPDIKFITIIDDVKQLQKLAQVFTKKYEYKNNKDILKINIDILKLVLSQCSHMKKSMDKKYDTYVIFDDTSTNDYSKGKKAK